MLFTIIRRNEKLAAKRSPMFDKNRFAKFLIYFMVAYWAALLLLMGVTLPSAFESAAPSMEPYHILNQGLIYVLITDFLVRFVIQTATSHEIKPYLLMPVKKKKLIDTLLLQSATSLYNLFWFFLFVPFAFLSIFYNPQIQISAESETKRSIFREKDKTKRSKKESAQHSKSRNKSFVMTSVSAL